MDQQHLSSCPNKTPGSHPQFLPFHYPQINQSPPKDWILSPTDFANPSTGLHCCSHYHPGSQGMNLRSGYVECEVQVGHSGGDVHQAAGHLDKRRET